MLRPRRNWTRGVAAQHASLSRWRSPVRIRSGPPSSHFPTPRPPARTGRSSARERRLTARPRHLCHTPAGETDTRSRSRSASSSSCSWRCWPSASSGPGGWVDRRERRPDVGRRAATRPTAVTTPADDRRRRAHPRRRPRRHRDARRRPPRSPTSRSSRSRTSAPTPTSTGSKELKAVLAGTSTRYTALELVEGEADAILAALGVERPADPERLVLAADAATLATDLAKNRKRLAFLRADAVGPEVRALAWGDTALFGVDRVKDLADWPLTARLPAPAAADAFDPATTWTLFAGGDIMLDRGVYLTLKKKGADFPFDGGTAEITGRCKDCSPLGWDTAVHEADRQRGRRPRPHRGRRHRGRQLREPGARTTRASTPRGPSSRRIPRSSTASPTPASTTSRSPTTTSATPARPGSSRRSRTSRSAGSRSRARARTLKAARTPAILEAAGTKVAILGYDAIAGGYHATATKVGSAGLSAKAVKADVAKARAAGADLVIVYPHWGTEYDPTPFANQKKLAEMIIDNGADMVIGNHAHWAGRDGGLQGQADLVRARQLRLRPDLVGADDGGDHPRADVPRQGPRPGPHPAAHHPRQGPAQLPRPGRARARS